MREQLNPVEALNALPGSLRPMGETPEVDPMAQPLWEIDPDFLNPYKELPPIQTWVRMGDRPALPKEGITTFSAKQKKGKSLSTYALAIPLLSGRLFDSVMPLDRPRLVIVFDMEMSEATLTKRVLTQVRSIGDNGCRFVVCSLKAKSIEERMKTIEDKIKRYSPDIVVIDQAAKLVYDINNTTECGGITDLLDKLSIGRAVWVVMHENKSEGDTNMRGHLGSYLSFAAVEAYSVDRKDGVFTITPKEARDTDTDNAACARFALDEDFRIIDATSLIERNREAEAENWRNDFKNLFGDNQELTHAELRRRVKEQLHITSDSTAEGKIRRAKEAGAICKVDPNNSRSPYKLTNSATAITDFDNLDNL
ncbi:MAG: AAA family ATPase [Prevotella sp.]|jgi:hypothetical protein|nr:AAA family ATPase [Prevotella sp.]